MLQKCYGGRRHSYVLLDTLQLLVHALGFSDQRRVRRCAGVLRIKEREVDGLGRVGQLLRWLDVDELEPGHAGIDWRGVPGESVTKSGGGCEVLHKGEGDAKCYTKCMGMRSVTQSVGICEVLHKVYGDAK